MICKLGFSDCMLMLNIHVMLISNYIDSLLTYFSQFGEVCDCVVMKNPQTGKSRGFGFVTFKDPNCVDTVLSTQHTIDSRQVSEDI